MIDLSDKIAIGRIIKKHGVHGQVVLESDLLSDAEEFELELVYIIIDGKPVPFFIEEFRSKTHNTFILKLKFVDSEKDALELNGNMVHAAKSGIRASVDNTSLSLIGFRLYSHEEEFLGVISDIETPDINPLFVVNLPDGSEHLYPAHSDFMVSVDTESKVIIIQLPEGFDRII